MGQAAHRPADRSAARRFAAGERARAATKNGNFVLSEVKLTLGETADVGRHRAAAFRRRRMPRRRTFDAEQVLDGKPQTGWAIGGFAGKPHQLTLQLARPVAPEKGKKLFLKLEQNYAQATHVIGRFRVLGSSDVTVESIAPAAVVKVLDEYPDRRNPALIPPLYAWLEKVDDEFVAASSALELAQATLPKPPLMDVRVIAQRAAIRAPRSCFTAAIFSIRPTR